MRGSAKLRNYLIILLDAAVIFLCFYIVLLFGRDDAFYRLLELRKIIYVVVAVTVLVFIFTDMYGDLFKKYNEIILNCAIAGITGIGIFYILVQVRVWHSGAVRISYLLVILLMTAFLSAGRILLEMLYRTIMKVKVIAIVGDINESLRIGYEFIKNKEKTHEIKYIFNAETGLGKFGRIVNDTDIIIMCPGIRSDLKDEIVRICAGNDKDVLLIPELYEINTMRPRLTQIDDTPYLYFDSRGLTGEEKFIKRAFDLLFSILLAIITFPVMLVCMLIIRLESKGSALFSQERVSRDGVFNIYKLRTMVSDAEKETGAVISGANDSRITKFGKFLRKSRLDEVPQIYNVIKGDMSLIGPRPERPEFIQDFIKKYPDYDKRHAVKAGISGLAQIMGKYSTNAWDKLRYDLIYIRNYSIMLDIKIFFLTLKTVFLEPGSVQDGSSIDYAVEMKKYDIEIIS
jgi:exopolysaccharide biosynthesis polyprenyl glycosylphosphotransferase